MECEVRRRRRSFEIYGISVLELGVGPRRWIGRLRLHAGKYILGIAAPTGTGVQALPPWDPGASRSIPPISAVCCGVCVITRQAIKRTCCFHPCDKLCPWPLADIPSCAADCPLSGVKRTWALALQMSAFDPKRTCQSFDLSRSATRRAISAGASSGIGNTELTLISPST
jgi:hypothetical protein